MGDVADDVLLISESPPRLKSSNLPRQIPDLKQATKIESNYATPNSRVGNGQPQYRDLAEQIKSNPRKPLKKRIYKSPKKTFCRFVLKLLFSHIGLCLIVGGYAAFGAWLFIQIELDDEQTRKQLKDDKIIEVNETINYLADVFWYYLDKNFTYKDWTSMVQERLKGFELYIIDLVEEYQYDGQYGKWEYDWVFPKSLLYSVSLMSTIGYGHITPKTQLGMITTILYAVIGIPLLLLVLANVGSILANGFKYAYSRLCCRWCRSRRKISEYQKGDENIVVPRHYMRLEDENVGSEDYMPTTEVLVPIVLNVGLIMLYIIIGSVIFSFWEGWSLIEAVYFTFITLSTTGLGDYVPGYSFLNYSDGFQASMRMLFTCIYCAFGMSLVTMSILLIHQEVQSKLKWFAVEIGLTKSDEEIRREKQELLKTQQS